MQSPRINIWPTIRFFLTPEFILATGFLLAVFLLAVWLPVALAAQALDDSASPPGDAGQIESVLIRQAVSPTPDSQTPDSQTPDSQTPGEDQDAFADDEAAPDLATHDTCAAPAPRVCLSPAAFEGIVPGKSTAADLDRAWGQPTETIAPKDEKADQDAQIRVYDHESLGRIQVHLKRGQVQLIQIQLPAPAAPEDLAEQLALADVRPTYVPDAEGHLLGLAFPELGVLMSIDPASDSLQVAQIIFEPIDAQPFVVRAESNLHGPYQLNLADLEFAIERQADYAYAHWLTAEIYFAIGKIDRARAAAERAVELDRNSASFRVTLARCLAAGGQYDAAIKLVTTLLNRKGLAPVIQAQALVLLGDLIAAGPNRNMHQALKLHTKAIRLADPLAVAKRVAVRRAAKEVLIDAHLATARDIAWGNWQQRTQTVPKWLERASAFAEESIDNEHASLELRLRIAQQALSAYSGVTPPVEPSGWVREARQTADQLLASTDDPLFRQRIHWQLGMAYFHALVSARAGGQDETALDYGHLAIKHLDLGARERETTPADDHLVGRLFFQIGTVHAVGRKDAAEAVTWYDRAAKRLAAPLAGSLLADPRLHGNSLISMGVTYWQADQRDRAVALTETGAEILRSAVAGGLLKEVDLSVAFGNLSTMHAELGDNLAARRYAERAEPASQQRKRR